MKPLPASVSPCSSRSLSLVESRSWQKSKRRSGSKVGATKQPKVSTFCKKLVAFKYMGCDRPMSFTRKDSSILVRGLLPDISLEATEEEIRSDIISVLHSSKEFDLTTVEMNDFEFIDVNGKHCVVPIYRDGQKFNGRSIKQIAGAGAVYIRLLKKLSKISDNSDFEVSTKSDKVYDSDSDFEFPSFNFPWHQKSTDSMPQAHPPPLSNADDPISSHTPLLSKKDQKTQQNQLDLFKADLNTH